MADTDTALLDPTDELAEEEYAYAITVEEAGPATKKVTVQIPHDRIAAKLEEQYGEMRTAAQVPGFRIGRAPRGLIEKKFGTEIKSQVAQELVRESYQQALAKNDLKVLGEPEFDESADLDLPAEGDMTYSFAVEVRPQIDLPDLSMLTVKKPVIPVTDEHIDQAMQNLREQQGVLVPVEDRGVEEKDYLSADVTVTAAGEELAKQEGAQLVARPGRIAGIEVADFATKVEGMQIDETRTITATVPQTHPKEGARGQEASIAITLKHLKRLEEAAIDQDFLESLGFENEQELRDALKQQMEERVETDVKQNMRSQVTQFLLANVQMELPEKLSANQADRVVNRRAMTLMQRGMAYEEIAANVERLRTGAGEEAARELKLFFILQKAAEDLGVSVDDRELNGQIASLAIQQDARPETVKQQMKKDGSLQNLYLQMMEQKSLDALLEKATVEEVEMDQQKLDAENAAAEAAETGEITGNFAASGGEVGATAEVAAAEGQQEDVTGGHDAT